MKVYFPPDVFVIYFLNFPKKKKNSPGVSREVGRRSTTVGVVSAAVSGAGWAPCTTVGGSVTAEEEGSDPEA